MRESDEDRAKTHNSISAESRGPTVQTGSARDIYFGRPSGPVKWIGIILACALAVVIVLAAVDRFGRGEDGVPAAGQPSSGTANSGIAAVRSEGRVDLRNVNLDLKPPNIQSDGSQRSVWASGIDPHGEAGEPELHGLGPGTSNTPPTIAAWNGPDDPNRQQCADRIGKQGAAKLTLTDSSRFCVRTAGNRIAYIDEVSFDPAKNTVTAFARVWESTGS
ncbi:hypothetical protein INP57_06990 [Saccharopolyspora sp. HNM0986]|uniref:hypothetical protein n=1 Tax=Saccharopolyspora galaxeae TaxID=2781241 RepID=UPI00190DBA40|nr:hypothetical protein [Saccharopolyspora sp. HNM0986]MBK0866542.1 hypothetical protein [Saccharopolyspora sp. HNM0986]